MRNLKTSLGSRAAAAFAVGLLALGACGSDGLKKVAINDPMARAEAAVAEAQSVELEITTTQNLALSAEGESMEINTKIEGRGVVELDASPRGKLESTVTTKVGGKSQKLTQTVITDGTEIYTELPDLVLSDSAAAAKKWLKMGTSQFGVTNGGQGGQTYLEVLKGLNEVDRVGNERIRNKDVTHYRGKLNWDYARSQLKPGNPRVEALIDAMSESLKDAPVDVWVDADDRPARIVTVIDLSHLSDQFGGLFQSMGLDPAEIQGGLEITGTQSVQVDYLAYGGPIDIELPPADQVTEMNMSDLLAGAGASSAAE